MWNSEAKKDRGQRKADGAYGVNCSGCASPAHQRDRGKWIERLGHRRSATDKRRQGVNSVRLSEEIRGPGTSSTGVHILQYKQTYKDKVAEQSMYNNRDTTLQYGVKFHFVQYRFVRDLLTTY